MTGIRQRRGDMTDDGNVHGWRICGKTRYALRNPWMSYARVQFSPEVPGMENKQYLNPFVDVHAKVKEFKARLLEANRDDATIRDKRNLMAAKEALDDKAN